MHIPSERWSRPGRELSVISRLRNVDNGIFHVCLLFKFATRSTATAAGLMIGSSPATLGPFLATHDCLYANFQPIKKTERRSLPTNDNSIHVTAGRSTSQHCQFNNVVHEYLITSQFPFSLLILINLNYTRFWSRLIFCFKKTYT